MSVPYAKRKTGIAFVGCGYVADLYIATLENWPDTLSLKGVFDIREDRAKAFCDHYEVNRYQSFEEILADPEVEIVVNLTNPHAHYAITKAALNAGKHVYTEKPIALDLEDARELVDLAAAKGLQIVSAPSSVLGEAAQTMLKAVRDQILGKPQLVYAELDDGMIHRIGYERWVTESGAQWPAEDEFQTGCTLEHAGYALTWLVAMFGPVRRVVSFARCLETDKGPKTPPNYTTPDFSCACMEFDGGVVARMTNSIIAPHDHRFRVHCEHGHISVEETWDFVSPVRATPIPSTVWRRTLVRYGLWDGSWAVPRTQKRKIKTTRRGYSMDFSLGIADMANAISSGVPARLSGEFSLHITEVSLAIQHPDIYGVDYVPVTAPARPLSMEYGYDVSENAGVAEPVAASTSARIVSEVSTNKPVGQQRS